MDAIEREVIFDTSGTRAYMETPEGEFICSRMTIHGNRRSPDSITLIGVGKTASRTKAQQWLILGIVPGDL